MGFVSVDGFGVTGDPGIEAFGDSLAVVRLFELGGIILIGDEAYLCEDRGHVGADEDNKRSLFDATVVEVGVAFF